MSSLEWSFKTYCIHCIHFSISESEPVAHLLVVQKKQGVCFLRSSPRFCWVPKQRPRHVVRFGLSSYLGWGRKSHQDADLMKMEFKKQMYIYIYIYCHWVRNNKKGETQASAWCHFWGFNFATGLKTFHELTKHAQTKKTSHLHWNAESIQKLRSHQLQQSHRALVGIEYQMV